MGKANPARMNGVNKVVYQLATRQVEAGIAASVWGFTKDLKPNYGERNFRTVLFREEIKAFRLDPDFACALQDLDRENTVFHLHGGWVPLFHSAAKALRRAGLRYVITAHGAYNTIAMRRSKWKKKLYFHLYERALLRHASAIHCIGASEVTGLQAIYRTEKTVLLPYGMDIQTSEPVEGGSTEDFVFGFVGRLDYYTKGLDLLLDAFAELLKAHPAALLWIIGDGDGRGEVEQRIATLGIGPRVILYGARYGEEKDALIQRMQIFMHPSRNEGMPSAVLEAAALGVPSIVTEATNVGSYIGQYDAGCVVDNEDTRGLSEAMTRCARLPDETLRYMGRQAARMVTEEFSWSKVVLRFNRLYV